MRLVTICLFICLLIMLGSANGLAADSQWDGTVNDLWNNAANWSGLGSKPPSAEDTALFNNDGSSNIDLNLSGDPATAKSIHFTGESCASYVIGTSPEQTLTLSEGGAITLDSDVTQKQVFPATIILGGNYGFISDREEADSLVFPGGDIRSPAGGATLILGGTGQQEEGKIYGSGMISSAITDTGAGALKLEKTGTGTWTLMGSNDYRGGTAINEGRLGILKREVTILNTLGSGLVTVNDSGTLTIGEPGYEIPIKLDNDFSVQGIGYGTGTDVWGAILNLQNSILAGEVTLTGDTTIVCNEGRMQFTNDDSITGNHDLTIGGASIVEVLGSLNLGTGSLTKNGLGVLFLGAANDYSGGTILDTAAVIEIWNAGALGSGPVTIRDNAAIFFRDLEGAPLANDFVVQGDGHIYGAIVNGNGDNTLSGKITLSGDANIKADEGSSLTLTGDIDGEYDLTLGRSEFFEGHGNITVSGVIKTGAGAVIKEGNGTLTLSGSEANTYLGPTVVNAGSLLLDKTAGTTAIAGDITISGGTLRWSASNQVADTSAITMTSGALDLNGKTETIAAFSNGGGVFMTGAGHLIGAGSTITWSGGTNTVNDGGKVEDSHIVITGGLNIVNGGTTGGVLQLNGGGAGLEMSSGSTLTLNSNDVVGGKLLLEGDMTTSGDDTVTIANGGFATNSGVIDLDGGTRTFTVADGDAAQDLLITAVITNGGLVKEGAGTLVLLGKNTYSGGTVIDQGVLRVMDDLTNVNILGSGAVAINDGGTLHIGNRSATSIIIIKLDNDFFIQGTGAPLGEGHYGAIASVQESLLTGVVTLTDDATIMSNHGALEFAGSVLANDYDLTIDGEFDVAVSGVMDLGTGSVTKQGGGTLFLCDENTYSGGTLLGHLGAINIRHAGALGSGHVTIQKGAYFIIEDLNGTPLTNDFTVEGFGVGERTSAIGNYGNNVLSGRITLSGDTEIRSTTGASLTLNGDIDGAYNLILGKDSLAYPGDGDISIGGIIQTGSGSVIKNGNGVLTLSGANTYTGATTVNSGTLKIGSSGAIPDNSALTLDGILDMNGNDEIIGSLSGTSTGLVTNSVAGTFVKLTVGDNGSSPNFAGVIEDGLGLGTQLISTGTLALSGANTYTGGTIINAGTLHANSVAALGVGAVTNNAILDIGTTALNIGANTYTQAAESTLVLTANSASSFGSINSTAAAAIAADSTIEVTVGGYIPNGATLTVVNTGGSGIGNVPTTITSSNPYVTFSAANSGNNLILAAIRAGNNSFAGAGAMANSNAAVVGNVLDNVTNPSADMTTVLTALGNLSQSQVASSLESMAPVVDGGQPKVTNELLNGFVRTALLRLQDSKIEEDENGRDLLLYSASRRNDIWAQFYGDYAHQDKRGLSNGYLARIWGTVLGIDRLFMDDTLRLGLAQGFGFSKIRSKDNYGRTGIDSYQTGLYGEYQAKDSPYIIDAVLTYGYNNYDSSRHVTVGNINRIAQSDYHGHQFSSYFEAGYKIQKNGFDIIPLISLTYTHLYLSSYTETGADSLNLSVNSQKYDSLQPGIGLRLSRAFENKSSIITPEFRFRYFYDAINDRQQTIATFAGGGTSFKTEGYKPAPSSFDFGARLEFFNKKNITLLADCNTVLKDDYYEVGGSLTFKYSF